MRKTMFVVAVLTALLAPAAAVAGPSRYDALFDALWGKVDENFYDPHFHGLDWKAVGARYRGQLAGVHSDAEFQKLASAMLGELHASHTYIQLPSNSPASSVGIGVRFHTIGGATRAVQGAPVSGAGVVG